MDIFVKVIPFITGGLAIITLLILIFDKDRELKK